MSATNFREAAELAQADALSDRELEIYREQRDAILAGPDVGDVREFNSLTDSLLESVDFHKLLHVAVSSGPAVAGAALQDLIRKVMRKAAATQADEELERFAD